MEDATRAAAASRWALSDVGTAMFADAMGESEAARGAQVRTDVVLSSETWADGTTFTGYQRLDGSMYIVTRDSAGVRYIVEDTRPGVLGELLVEENVPPTRRRHATPRRLHFARAGDDIRAQLAFPAHLLALQRSTRGR